VRQGALGEHRHAARVESQGSGSGADWRASRIRVGDNAPIAGDVGGARSVAHRADHAHNGARLHESSWPVDGILQSSATRRKAIRSMRYVMSQKFFSLADSFTIKDENERDVFLVKG